MKILNQIKPKGCWVQAGQNFDAQKSLFLQNTMLPAIFPLFTNYLLLGNNLISYFTGDKFEIPFRSPLDFRSVVRSMTSTAFLLPDDRIWPASVPLVITPKRNYSSHDYEQFFRDLNYTVGEYHPFKSNQIYLIISLQFLSVQISLT